MSGADTEWERALQHSLARMNQALGKRGSLASPPPEVRAPALPPLATVGAVAAASALVAVAVVTGQLWILAPAAGLGALGALPFLARTRRARTPKGPAARAHVGMGATVAADAVLEPGATIEMGVTVCAGATIRSGAVVRWGATIGERAVIEKGAAVSWGATVNKDAVVGEGATVGAGADVAAGARLPAGTTLWPGATWRADRASAPVALPPQEGNPREERVRAVCDRLETELREAPQAAREFLGGSLSVIASLRSTCVDLLSRERAMRAEADPASLARLDEERAALARRVEAESDAITKGSLQGAVAAIDEQRRQRELLRRNADRLEAEQTRLLYTLEGMATQFVRLRTTAGAEPGSGLGESVGQLRDEIEAIADALEQVSAPGVSAVVDVAPAPEGEARTGERTRE